MEASISSSPPAPAVGGSTVPVSIVSPPPDGLPNGSALSGDSNTKVPDQSTARTSRPLNILQWNADGLNNKIFELTSRLINSNIDIVAIQESKLISKGPRPDRDPKVPGYRTIRKDRHGTTTRGRGLLFFIKEDVRFLKGSALERTGLETLTIKVQVKKGSWVDITNCYLPSSRTQEAQFDPAIIPSGPNSIIVGDFNAHSASGIVTQTKTRVVRKSKTGSSTRILAS